MKQPQRETIKLSSPIEVDGVQTDTLTMRRPRVRDLKLMDNPGTDIENSIHFIAALCEVPPAAVEELDAEDFTRISEKVAGFMSSAGKTSST